MKKRINAVKILSGVVLMCLLMVACGKEDALIGTWCEEPGSKEEGTLTLAEDGVIKENLGIFDDSYGISYKLSDDKILFVYYGEIECQATYEIDGDKLTLHLENESDPIVLFRQ